MSPFSLNISTFSLPFPLCLDLPHHFTFMESLEPPKIFPSYLPNAYKIWDMMGLIPFPVLGTQGLFISLLEQITPVFCFAFWNLLTKSRCQSVSICCVSNSRTCVKLYWELFLNYLFQQKHMVFMLVCIQWGNRMALSLFEKWEQNFIVLFWKNYFLYSYTII